MTYSSYTFNDKNLIKRWLQRRRLVVAINIAKKTTPQCVLDFGSGNGELCKLIALQFPKAKIICYEPTPYLMKEAKENLAVVVGAQVHFCNDITQIADGSVDLIFCLEVFEHLPKAETMDALGQVKRLLKNEGDAVLGVPIEIGIPALYKGVFRMLRRFGSFDASFKNVFLSIFYCPPKERPIAEITPGFTYHHLHMGFDYRNLKLLCNRYFKLQKTTTSPFSVFGCLLNPEVYFFLQKNDHAINKDVER